MALEQIINKNKNKSINFIIVLMMVVLAFNIYKSQAKQLALLREKKDTEIKKNEVLGQIGESEEKIAEYKNLINNKDVTTLFDTLNSLAVGASVKITSLRPFPEADFPLFVKYPYDLKVEANNYHALGKFVSNLENHPDIFYVEIAKITPKSYAEMAQEGFKLNVDLKISTILLKD